jgi:hypothetical protein
LVNVISVLPNTSLMHDVILTLTLRHCIVGDDGKLYYDIGVRIQSYASRQQLAVSEEERQGAMVQEFDRVLMTTLGTANRRLYEFRLQTPYRNFNKSREIHRTMAESFRCKELA